MPDAANFQFEHPKGMIYGWFSRKGLCALLLPTPSAKKLPVLHSSMNDQRVWVLNAALDRYFSGIREDFSEIPLDLSAGTAFQQRVWKAALKTPWGKTNSYGELARRIRNPKASRAVGQALGRNPVPIVVPCHRFLAGNGGLGGFSAGLGWKRALLKAEGIAAAGL